MSAQGRFDPLAIIEVFNRHRVDYVVIGGFAAELHRVPIEPTRDIDFTPSTSPANLARVSAALAELSARVRTDAVPDGLPFSHDAASLARATTWNLTCPLGELDLSFRPSGTDGYDDLAQAAIRVGLPGGGEMTVAALADVLRSKEAAGRQKDLRALPELQRRLAVAQREPVEDQAVAMTRRAAERSRSPVAPRPGRQPAPAQQSPEQRLAADAARRRARRPGGEYGR